MERPWFCFINFTRFYLSIIAYKLRRQRLSAGIVFLHPEWWAPRRNGRHGLVYLRKQVLIPPRDLVLPASCQLFTHSFLPSSQQLFAIHGTVQREESYQPGVSCKKKNYNNNDRLQSYRSAERLAAWKASVALQMFYRFRKQIPCWEKAMLWLKTLFTEHPNASRIFCHIRLSVTVK